MNILTPFSSIEQMRDLISVGATELFCGYFPSELINQFNSDDQLPFLTIPLNKRANISANLTSIDELKKAVRIADEKKVKLFVAINSLSYPDVLWQYLEEYIHTIEAIGIKHCIISDIGLMEYLSTNSKLKITVSCLNNVFNTYQVQFYKQFHVERIVFPRHIPINTMIQICNENPDMDFEYFILSDKCIYDDGNCHCNHMIGTFCGDVWNSEYYSRKWNDLSDDEQTQLRSNEYTFMRWAKSIDVANKSQHRWKSIGCSICSLASTLCIPNIVSLKVVGRGYGINGLKHLITATNNAISIAKGRNIRSLQKYAKTVFENPQMCETNHFCIIRG